MRAKQAAVLCGVAAVVVAGTALMGLAMVPSAAGRGSGPTASLEPNVIMPCCGGGGGGGIYLVYFNETGLPAGTLWSVAINNTVDNFWTSGTSASMMDNSSWTNGTWAFTVVSYGYLANPTTGSITVNGKNVYKQVSFTQETVSYDVYFNETGLPKGSAWYCSLYETPTGKLWATAESTTATCTINADNGPYTWSVTPPQYYKASPSSGSVTVKSAPVSASSGKIAFSELICPLLQFNETGLSGQTWYVNVSNSSWYLNLSTTGGNLQFDPQTGAVLYPMTYHYVVTAPSGMNANPQVGNLNLVGGKSTYQKITFKQNEG